MKVLHVSSLDADILDIESTLQIASSKYVGMRLVQDYRYLINQMGWVRGITEPVHQAVNALSVAEKSFPAQDRLSMNESVVRFLGDAFAALPGKKKATKDLVLKWAQLVDPKGDCKEALERSGLPWGLL